MRKLILVSAPLALPIALAACSQGPAETEEAAPEVVEEVAMTTANGSAAGTFTVTTADGEAGGNSMLNADGTYQDMNADGTIASEGTWEVVDGKTCFTASEEGSEAVCWSEGEPGEDGSFTATNDAGESVTVTPVAAEEEAAEEAEAAE